ncbi:phosphoesterase [Candidatus Woesearchaeota archaeon CG10_big_fil_rev_8_21_14_0_10_34_8]|nr:MAG: phosphoesterase [Candidatus Woesearchaeota archaeon CG10_big_fil_rev_8_21_14_0_10_34_8]
MQIINNVEIVDLGLYFKKYKLLAITDLQFGYEENLNRQGVLVPRFVHKEILQRMEAILKKRKIDSVLVNGDIKHEFGRISETEWRYCIRFFKLLEKYVKKIILVKGNHDTMLDPIAKTRGLDVVDHYVLNDVLFVHGDSILDIAKDKNIKTIIIGHEHPAVSVIEGPRVEKYKAFLVGKWKQKKLVMLPSFNTATEGTDVLKERLLSPFLREVNVKKFEAYIVADKVYYFGRLGDLKSRF